MDVRREKAWKVVLSSSAPLNDNVKFVIKEIVGILNKNKTAIDLVELYCSIEFQSESIEHLFISMMIKFIDSCDVVSLKTMRNLVMDLSEKNKLKQIMEFIPCHIEMFKRDKVMLAKHLSQCCLSQMKFYMCLLMKLAGNTLYDNRKVTKLMQLCLDVIIELLKLSIATKNTDNFIEILSSFLTPRLKLFEILLSKFHKQVFQDFVTNFINTLIDSDYAFALPSPETEDNTIFYLFTKLFAEVFSEKIPIEFSLDLLEQFVNDLCIKYAQARNVVKFLNLYCLFFGYLRLFKNFHYFFKILTEIVAPNELTFDFLLTICEIINRIENNGIINRADHQALPEFEEIFNILSKYMPMATINKTFCSHCTSSKRHAIIDFCSFYIRFFRSECKKQSNFCNKANLAKCVCIIKYSFVILNALRCSTQSFKFNNMYTLTYNFTITLSASANENMCETAMHVTRILLKYRNDHDNPEMTVDKILLLMLPGLKQCNLNRYLEVYCFLVVWQMVNKTKESDNVEHHLSRIIHQFYLDSCTEYPPYPTFIEVLDAIGESLYEIPTPQYNKIDILFLILETVVNYKGRTNIRIKTLRYLFKIAATDKNNYEKIGKFLANYKYIDNILVREFIQFYEEFEKQTTHMVLQYGLFKHKIFVLITDYNSEQKKTIDCNKYNDLENLDKFVDEKITQEKNLLQNLFDSLDYLTRFIVDNYQVLDQFNYKYICEVFHSIGQLLYFYNYKTEATQAFGLLLVIALSQNYSDSILDGLNYFLNNIITYQMFRDCNVHNRKIFDLPIDFNELLELRNRILKERNLCNTDERVVINYLNYSKYLIDANRNDEFFTCIKEISALFGYGNEDDQLNSNHQVVKCYHLKLILLIVYYKINNDSEKNATSPVLTHFLNFLSYFKLIKNSTVAERLESNNMLFDAMEYFSDFIISKRLFHERDYFLGTTMKYALKVGTLKRFLGFLLVSIKLDILIEGHEKMYPKLRWFNRVIENKCFHHNDGLRYHGDVECKIANKNSHTIAGMNHMPAIIFNDFPAARNYNIHIDQIETIKPLEFPNVEQSPKLHELNCQCTSVCRSDLTIRLMYVEMCLLIGRVQSHCKQNKKAKQIFENGLKYLKYLQKTYIKSMELQINLANFQLIKINLYENMAHVHIAANEYEKAAKMLYKAKKNFNFIHYFLPLGYYQRILMQLKFTNRIITDNTFLLSTVIQPASYNLSWTPKMENIAGVLETVQVDSGKKKSPKVQCIPIVEAAAPSFDLCSTSSENDSFLGMNVKAMMAVSTVKRGSNRKKASVPIKNKHDQKENNLNEILDSPKKKTISNPIRKPLGEAKALGVLKSSKKGNKLKEQSPEQEIDLIDLTDTLPKMGMASSSPNSSEILSESVFRAGLRSSRSANIIPDTPLKRTLRTRVKR